ncbi:MAG TPA: organomercurial lyase [bacterium]|nr:organomercurial lyase [bacterium]
MRQLQITPPSAPDSEIRLWIYWYFASTGRAPSPVEVAREFVLTPDQAERALTRLQREADALVLIPGSPYIWMAEPFSAVPTSFLVRSREMQWWGNCVWDAFGILALLGVDGEISTACPNSGQALRVTVIGNGLAETAGIVHFAVPARDWWRDIGFT